MEKIDAAGTGAMADRVEFPAGAQGGQTEDNDPLTRGFAKPLREVTGLIGS